MANKNPEKSSVIRFYELEIVNCLSCSYARLSFSVNDNVHLILYSNDNPNQTRPHTDAATPVGLAIRLLCTMEYATDISLENIPQLKIGAGFVRGHFKITHTIENAVQPVDDDEFDELDMQPCTSQQAIQRQLERELRQSQSQIIVHSWDVTAERRFDDESNLDKVTFNIDGGQSATVTVDEFYGMFFMPPVFNYGILRKINDICCGNWLRLIQADDDPYSKLKDDGNPFEVFANYFIKNEFEPNEFLNNLASKCVESVENTRLAERKFILDIFSRVRQIFEYFTFDEYSIWFFVPRDHLYQPLECISVEDFDLTQVRTSIKLRSDKSSHFLHNANHNIQDILMAAFQLALTCASNQSVLILNNFDELNKFICLKYFAALYMNKYNADNLPKWIVQRYLQRIIDLCKSSQALIFIEYPGGLTLLSEERVVYKCSEDINKNTGELSWTVRTESICPNNGLPNIVDGNKLD